jgi:hypothetical protein
MTPFRILTRLKPATVRWQNRTGVSAPNHGAQNCCVCGRSARNAGSGAVLVPWRVVRDRLGHAKEVVNTSNQSLFGVRIVVAAKDNLGLSLPVCLAPGDSVRVWRRQQRVIEITSDPAAMGYIRWLTEDGRELLWPFTLD